MLALIGAGVYFFCHSHTPNPSVSSDFHKNPISTERSVSVVPTKTTPAVKRAEHSPSQIITTSSGIAAVSGNAPPLNANPSDGLAIPSTKANPNSKRAVEGSEQMYLAHYSLRTPQVANPNSVENRKILGVMVMKAIERARNSATQSSNK